MAKSRGLNWEKNVRNQRQGQEASEQHRVYDQMTVEVTAVRLRLRRKQDVELVDEILSLLDPAHDQDHVITWYRSSRTWLQDNPERPLRQDFHESALKMLERLTTRKHMQALGTWQPPDHTQERQPKGHPGRPRMSKEAVRTAVRKTTWKEGQARVKELSPWLADPSLLPKKPPTRKPPT